MLDHVSIMVTDLDRVERFYDAALAALDVPKAGRGDDSLDYGLRCDASRPDRSYLSILLDNLSERASRRHWCFKVADRAIMDAFWTAGLANGGQDGEVTGLRPRGHLNICRVPFGPVRQQGRGGVTPTGVSLVCQEPLPKNAHTAFDTSSLRVSGSICPPPVSATSLALGMPAANSRPNQSGIN